MSNQKKPTVFISYDWNDVSDLFIDDLKKTIIDVEFKVDKDSVGKWDSITQFMNTISENDFVVQLVTDKYLKSPNCLYEVMQLMKDEKWTQKTMTVIMKDAEGIYNDDHKLDYMEFWNQKATSFEERIKKLPASAVTEMLDVLEKYKVIRDNIGSFLLIAADRSNPGLDEAISAIEYKIYSRMPEIIRKEQMSLGQKALIVILENAVPLVNYMNKTMIIKNDYSKIDELKTLRSRARQLVMLYESKMRVFCSELQKSIESLINNICDFYDKSVWICSLEGSAKGLTGDFLLKKNKGVSNSSTQMKKLLQDIQFLYDSLKKSVVADFD